jgi:lysophospholipase L1-like esterase
MTRNPRGRPLASRARLLAAAALLLARVGSAAAQGPDSRHWVATWGTAQQYAIIPATLAAPRPPQPVAAPAPPPAAPALGAPARRFGVPARLPGVKNQTIRMVARTSIAGQMVRVRLYNALGAGSVTLGGAHLALRGSGSAIVPGSDRVLTFGGRTSVVMYAGQTLLSDPVRLDVPALTDLAVSLYLPGEVTALTYHWFGLRPTYLSREGDFTGAAEITDPAATMESYYWLAGIDVMAPAGAGVIVGFGDSITDGDQSTPDSNGMWPALLARRLQANPATRNLAVANAGIAGNRILGDNGGGLVRLAHDALTVPGVRWITLLEGINDISGGAPPGRPATLTAEELIGAYRQVIEQAHALGVKVVGCTITPYGGSSVYSEAGEAIRQAANRWIRTSGAFDAVVDFDAVVRDPSQPDRMRPEADSPDLLHPGDAGYRMMADAFDLGIFGTGRAPGR